jgi:hypothetical protein
LDSAKIYGLYGKEYRGPRQFIKICGPFVTLFLGHGVGLETEENMECHHRFGIYCPLDILTDIITKTQRYNGRFDSRCGASFMYWAAGRGRKKERKKERKGQLGKARAAK